MADYVTGLQNPQSLTGSGNYLYVLQLNTFAGSYFISQIDLTTASVTPPDPWVTLPSSISPTSPYAPTGWILALGDYVYIPYNSRTAGSFPNPDTFTASLYRVQISTKTITANWVSVNNVTFQGITTDGTYLYVGAQSTAVIINPPNYIYKIDSSNPVATVWTNPSFFPLGLVYANTYIFASSDTDYTQIAQFDSSGNLVTSNWVTGGTLPNSLHYSLTTWYDFMYVSNLDGTVSQLELSTGAITNASYVSGYAAIQGIVAYDTYLYVGNLTIMGSIGRYALETPCFCRDTLLLTPTGYRKVQDLRQGDTVQSPPDNRPVTIRKIFCEEIVGDRSTIPYRIPQHFFGDNLPSEDILLSCNHAFFCEGQWTFPGRVPGLHADVSFLGKRFEYYHVTLPEYGQDKLWCSGLPVDSWDTDTVKVPLPPQETLCREKVSNNFSTPAANNATFKVL